MALLFSITDVLTFGYYPIDNFSATFHADCSPTLGLEPAFSEAGRLCPGEKDCRAVFSRLRQERISDGRFPSIQCSYCIRSRPFPLASNKAFTDSKPLTAAEYHHIFQVRQATQKSTVLQSLMHNENHSPALHSVLSQGVLCYMNIPNSSRI